MNIKLELKNAYEMVKSGGYVEAMKLCDDLLASFPMEKKLILRKRSLMHDFAGNLAEALNDRVMLIESGLGDIEDIFLSGHLCTELRNFVEAEQYFDRVIEMEKNIGANGRNFSQSSHLYKALCYFELRDLESVESELANVGGDEKIWVFNCVSPITKRSIQDQINQIKNK